MRLVACLLLLVARLAASVAHAQPVPPDEALINETVETLHAEEQMATSFAGIDSALGRISLTPAAVADSIRARLRADYRPDLLRAALPTLQSPAYRHATERAADRSGSFARATQLMFGPPPKKGTLADSALAARYLDASGTERTLQVTMERMVRAVVESVPAARAELEAEGLTVDEAVERALAATSETISMFALPAMRAELAGVPVGEVETLIAYYGSPAGAYVQSALLEGTLDAVIPAIVVLATAEIPAYTGEAGAEEAYTEETEDVDIPVIVPVPYPKGKF